MSINPVYPFGFIYPYYPNIHVHPYHHLSIPFYVSFRQQNQFPPINIKELEKSANKFQELMQQAHLLTARIVESATFAKELMTAAQLSDVQKVEQMIRSTGITARIKTTVSPTGLRVTMENFDTPGGCCDLLIALRW